MTALATDIRYACRTLASQPAWALAAILCVAIGTGANTAFFSIANGVLLRPLEFDKPEQLVMVALRPRDRPQPRPFSLTEFREIETPDSFDQLAARTYLPVSLTTGNSAAMAQAEFVTGGYFKMLRIRPLAGRFWDESADRPGAPIEAVISERLWRTRFGSDFGVVRRGVRVNGRDVTIAGVAPAGFVGATRLIAADLWIPAMAHGAMSQSDSPRAAAEAPMFGVMGRLAGGVSREQARHQLNQALAGRLPAIVSEVEEAAGFGVPPAVRSVAMGGSAILFGLMGLLASIAIANVAGLMVARAAGRQRETGLRLALGASAARIVRLVLFESLLLAFCGACVGGVVAFRLPNLLTGLGPRLPEHLAFAVDISPDWRVLIYTALSAFLVGALVSLAPSHHAMRIGVMDALKQAGGRGAVRSGSRIMQGFVVGQVAVSTLLLVIAGLLVRTYLNTQAVDPGFDLQNATVTSLDLNQAGFDRTAGSAFQERLLQGVLALPGVRRATLSREAPLSPGGQAVEVQADISSSSISARQLVVAPGYFDTIGIPLLHGDDFHHAEPAGRDIAVVNQTLAQRLWPRRSPVGSTFQAGARLLEVVGVVKDAKIGALSEASRAVFYEPLAQMYSPNVTLIVRSAIAPGLLADSIRTVIRSGNRDLSVVDIRTLEDQFRESAAPSRQRALVLVAVCVAGLLLSSVGLFGVISYDVRGRVREFGIRMALGARPWAVMKMVFGQALQLVGTGLAIGMIAAYGAARLLAGVIFGIGPHDPLTLGVVALTLGVIALAASYWPARWATSVDPMLAVRSE